MSIRITITDDHSLIISGMQNILHPYKHIKVVSTYTSGKALLEGLKIDQPDVLLLDLQMPGITGNELVPIIRKSYPDIRILILTGQDDLFNAQQLIQQGCRGYLLKTITEPPTFVAAIEQVYNGELFLEPSMKENLLNNMLHVKKQSEKIIPTLTRREKEILQLIATEYSNQEIADKLFLSIRTVESHRLSLLQKLDVKNIAGLVKKAIQMGLC